ncbi:TPA: hypothetical protein UME34_000373 [Stenotrophomonas maltophilia]|uniref:hypothetical protein n=1 Tax=Stenotrophomonas maltophilia TaxID=40324 RepID=UPI001FA6EE9C|nr:hypothetical protein [Stenotrophomonas maltophilia]HEL3173817.1 hypothetical protein [Stenotrophomonas maltophilia]
MSAHECTYIDIQPHLVDALVLGANAIRFTPTRDWEEARANLGAELTPAQLEDLVRWTATFFSQTGDLSAVHESILDHGVGMQLRLQTGKPIHSPWQTIHAYRSTTHLYIASFRIEPAGSLFQVVASDVYRCVTPEALTPPPTLDQAQSEDFIELESIRMSNDLDAMRRAVELVSSAQSNERFFGRQTHA